MQLWHCWSGGCTTHTVIRATSAGRTALGVPLGWVEWGVEEMGCGRRVDSVITECTKNTAPLNTQVGGQGIDQKPCGHVRHVSIGDIIASLRPSDDNFFKPLR